MDKTAVRTVALPIARRRYKIAGMAETAIAFAIAISWLALTGLIYLAQTNYVAHTTYAIQKLEAEKTQWLIRNEQLQAAIVRLESSDRIEKLAVERLRMAPPEKILYARLPDTPLSPAAKAEPLAEGPEPPTVLSGEPEGIGSTIARSWWSLLHILRGALGPGGQ